MTDDENRKAAERAQRPQQAASLTEARVMIMFKRFATNLAQVHAQREAALVKRIAELEDRVDELALKPGAINIEAREVSVPGMSAMAAAFDRLTKTIASPLRPIYNAKGILVGARRVETLPDEASERDEVARNA